MVSVIVPAYNQAQYLNFALDSVLAQTFTDWECWIVDDGSTDATGAIADQYAGKDDRFKVIHQANQGLAGARNAGIAAARGEFFIFLDSDDGLHPTMMARLAGQLSANRDLTGVVCQARLIDQNNHPLQGGRKREGQIKWNALLWSLYLRYPLEVFSLGNLFAPVCGCWRSEAIRSAGGFAKEPTGLEDFDLWLRVLEKHGPWGYENDILVDYRRVTNSMSGNAGVMSHGWQIALQCFFGRQASHLSAEKLEAWHQVADSVRIMVFPVAQDQSPAPSNSLEVIAKIEMAPAVAEAMRKVLIVNYILSGVDLAAMKSLKPSRQALALAHFTRGVRQRKAGAWITAVGDFSKSLLWSPAFIMGQVIPVVLKGGYYPIPRGLGSES